MVGARHICRVRIWAGYSGSLVVHQQPDEECPWPSHRCGSWRPSGERLYAQLSAVGNFRRRAPVRHPDHDHTGYIRT